MPQELAYRHMNILIEKTEKLFRGLENT